MWSAKFNLIHHRLYFSALLSLVLLTSIPELLLWLGYISGTNASGLMLELWIELAILMLEVFVHIVVYLNFHLHTSSLNNLFEKEKHENSKDLLVAFIAAFVLRLVAFGIYKLITTDIDNTDDYLLYTGSLILKVLSCLLYIFYTSEFKRTHLALKQLEEQEQADVYLELY